MEILLLNNSECWMNNVHDIYKIFAIHGSQNDKFEFKNVLIELKKSNFQVWRFYS